MDARASVFSNCQLVYVQGVNRLWSGYRTSPRRPVLPSSLAPSPHASQQRNTAQYSTAPHRTAQHNTSPHSTSQHITAQHSTPHTRSCTRDQTPGTRQQAAHTTAHRKPHATRQAPHTPHSPPQHVSLLTNLCLCLKVGLCIAHIHTRRQLHTAHTYMTRHLVVYPFGWVLSPALIYVYISE